MRKIFLLSIVLCAVISVHAQDVITLKNGDEIEALVQRIGEVEIAYKKWDFQDGPTFTIRKSEIFRIKYQNGTKDVFNDFTEPAETQTEQPQVEQTKQAVPAHLTPLQNEFYRIGANDKEMMKFFERNNFTDYYNRFGAACKQKKSATGLLVTGSAFTSAGIVMLICRESAIANAHPYEVLRNNNYQGLAVWGWVLTGAGQLLTIISVPVYAKAASNKKAIKNDFIKQDFGKEYGCLPALNIGITQSGSIGLTLNF